MRDEMRRWVGRPVMVQLDGEEESLGGTLERVTPTMMTLTGATLISPKGVPTSADGLIVINRASVVWVQVATDG